MSNVQLTDNLVRLRKSYNYTQKQIGDKLNISRQAYSNYERGKRIPDIGMLIRLADIYGVTLEQLLTQTCTKNGIVNESHGPYFRGMIIENAECFGLAQLHQLRGRIGRGKENSYCILLVGIDKEESWRRLKILEESRDGFRIAEEDLKQRGPGDFLGERQHGAPMFRFANLIYDYNLIQEARKLALAKVNSTGIFNGENEGIGYE